MTLIVYPVKDLVKAKALYGRLWGVEPYVDGPYYVGYRVGDVEFGLDPNGHAKGLTGPVCYWNAQDVARELQSLAELGATVLQPPAEVGGGMTVAIAADADGNAIGLRSA